MASEADLERVRELYRTLEEHRKQGSSVSSETPELREVLEQTLEPFAAVMRAIVAKVPLFKDCPESFLVDIAKSLEPEVYFPEEVMVRTRCSSARAREIHTNISLAHKYLAHKYLSRVCNNERYLDQPH